MNWTTGFKNRAMSMKNSSSVQPKYHIDRKSANNCPNSSNIIFKSTKETSQDWEIDIFDRIERSSSKTKFTGPIKVKKVDLSSREKLKPNEFKRVFDFELTNSPIPQSKLRLSSSSPIHHQAFSSLSDIPNNDLEILGREKDPYTLNKRVMNPFKQFKEDLSGEGELKKPEKMSEETQTLQVSKVDVAVQTQDENLKVDVAVQTDVQFEV
ncbi:hypothetical protein CHUAL_002872 [Chamberlinius hualienensis]